MIEKNYKQVIIKSADDMPKAGSDVIVHYTSGRLSLIENFKSDPTDGMVEMFMGVVDWYLIEQPVKDELTKANYMQVTPATFDDYMKLDKADIVKMLLECHRIMGLQGEPIVDVPVITSTNYPMQENKEVGKERLIIKKLKEILELGSHEPEPSDETRLHKLYKTEMKRLHLELDELEKENKPVK
jgi:hypothetical protein